MKDGSAFIKVNTASLFVPGSIDSSYTAITEFEKQYTSQLLILYMTDKSI